MEKKKDCDTCVNLKKVDDGRTKICDIGSLHFIRSDSLKDKDCLQWKSKKEAKKGKNR